MSGIIDKLGITPAPWEISKKVGGTVVSKNAVIDEEIKEKGHGELEYYGGVCVAESVLNRNINIIAASPIMIEGYDLIMNTIIEAEKGNILPFVALSLIKDMANNSIKAVSGKNWDEIK